ncbi:MAG TPA: transcription termination/antitermination NusG family protein [Pyrinomonadaceae bacterium]|nr:transcription termination/antitermination NusG family protein [Pyrinomonadaceae bacterium]
MNEPNVSGSSGALWYAINTHPKEEDRAASNLNAWKVETFNPKIRERRLNPFTGAPIYERKPLFPRYIFARFDAGILLSKIIFTRGVRQVVGFGNGPVPVEDEIIQFIKDRMDKDGLINLEEEFKRGDLVTVKDGLLGELSGIFEREIQGTDRVRILLNAINYQASIVIPKEHVRKRTATG